MLLDKINKSMSQIQSNNNYEKLSFIKRDLERLKSDVDKLDRRVSQYVDMNNTLNDYLENNSEIIFKESKYVNNQIDKILNNIKNNDFNNYELIKNIESTVDNYDFNLKDYWKQKYIKDIKVTRSILLILEKLYDDSEKILQIRSKVVKLENRWPFSKEDLNLVQEGINEATLMISKLNVSSNIQSFLQKVSNGEASISDLDDEVLLWLKRNKFENKVKLSFI